MRLILLGLLALALCFVLGCSGGGNSAGSAPQRTGKATITIKWPTRAAHARTFIPSATQSVVITLNNGNGFTVSQTINRDPSAATVSYTFTGVPVGAIAVTIQAYDGQNAGGSLLASGTSVTSVSDGQTATVTADMTSDVASVVISPYPSPVKAGQTAQLVATVLSSDGSTILEPAGDIYWTSSDAATATVDQTGLVTGVKAGTLTVTAQERESGVSGTISLTIAQGSGSLAVVLTSNITVTVSPSTPTLAPGVTQQFSATVTDVPNQAVLWSVQETNGGSITNAGLYTAPATPGTYHVIATSVANPSITGTATVTVSSVTNNSGLQIYVADQLNNRIVRMNDMTGAGWTTFGNQGSGVNQFNGLRSIAVSQDGKIYASDQMNGRIVRMNDMTGAGWTTLGGFNQPAGLGIGPDGKIYVADSQNNRIVRVDDIAGTNWTTCQGSTDHFQTPTNVTCDAHGNIYVTDLGNNRIVCMSDMTGANWTTFGSQGTGVDQFNTPGGVAIGPDGKIYITDLFNGRIDRIDDMTGANWTTFGSQGYINVGGMGVPCGITFGPDGKLYVADEGYNRIACMTDITGAGWITFGDTDGGNGVGQFSGPMSIVVRSVASPSGNGGLNMNIQ